MEETKAERFRRLAETRTNAAIDRIRIIGNLSNTSAYEYTDEEVAQIFRALSEAIRTTRAKFVGANRSTFRLTDEARGKEIG